MYKGRKKIVFLLSLKIYIIGNEKNNYLSHSCCYFKFMC